MPITSTNRKNGPTARRSDSQETAPLEITHDSIRCRAHEIFCNRNGGGGDHVTDWLQAERELNGESRSEGPDHPEIMSRARDQHPVNV
jgi:hypothetical protein